MDYEVEIEENKLMIIGDHAGPGKLSCHLFYKDYKVTQFNILVCQDGSFSFDVKPMKASSTYDDDTIIWMIETAFFENYADALVVEFLNAQMTSTVEDLEEL